MLNPKRILVSAMQECKAASHKTRDDYDYGASVLASAYWHLKGNRPDAIFKGSTVETWNASKQDSLF